MKNILFLVTGMTPQIVTETIWALACDPNNTDKWIPDEVHIFSTEQGFNQIKKRLFEDGVFQQMQVEYPQLQKTVFNENFFHYITKGDEVLPDVTTPAHNEVMADSLCETIRNLCQDKHSNLHVSLAGGRKTMGFYAGYALSLYGRSQDSLSHVLVEPKYEKATDFFYPTTQECLISDRDGTILNAQEAEIWLSKIPFVRMKQAIKDKHQLKTSDSLIDVVNKINESFKDVYLKLDVNNKKLIVNHNIEVNSLPAREFALLHWFADLRKNGEQGIIAPSKNATSSTKQQYIAKLTEEYIAYYELHKLSEKADESLEDVSVHRNFFDETKSRLNSHLQKELGLELSANIEITQNGRGKPFYLNINPQSIEIIDSFSE